MHCINATLHAVFTLSFKKGIKWFKFFGVLLGFLFKHGNQISCAAAIKLFFVCSNASKLNAKRA
jgi:hypothetical protein